MDVEKLPKEVLIHIFQFLNVRTRLNVAPVCKKWLDALKSYKLLCDIKVKFSKEIGGVQLFHHMKRPFECFSFHDIAIGDSEYEFLKKYSKQFVSLSFKHCNLNIVKRESSSEGELLHYDNLKRLEVQSSPIFPLIDSFPNVTHIKLHQLIGLSDSFISELGKLLKLEALTLGGIVFEEVNKAVSVNKETQQSEPSSSDLPFAIVKQLIEKNRTTLRNIEFLYSIISPEDLLNISGIEGLKLRHAIFPFNCNEDDIKKFCENQPSLVSLDFSSNLKVTNDIVCDVCQFLTNLEQLTIRYNRTIDNCIIIILQLQQLVKLDLFCSFCISQLNYRDAVSNLKAFKLKHLNLSLAKIGDESLCELLKRNQNIRYLDVSGTCISDKTLNMICKNLIFLEHLILYSCKNISDSGLTGEFENYSDSLTPTPLYNLKYLKELNLSNNYLITNDGCIKAIRFINLERLSMDHCYKLVIDDNFETLLKKQNPILRVFNKTSHKNG